MRLLRKQGTGLDFTKKNSNQITVRYKGAFTVALCCCLVIVGAFSFMWLWRSVDYDFNNMFAQRETTETTVAATTEPVPTEPEGVIVLLIVHTSDGGGVLRSVCEVKTDFGSGSTELYPCSLDALCVYNDRSMSVEECYKTYGPAALGTAAKSVTGVNADRYLRVRDSGFVNIIKLLGDITYVSPSAISYTTDDVVLELPAGEQQLKSASALKLVKYNNASKSAGDAAYCNAYFLGSALCMYFTEKNALMGEELFSSVINYVETDVSVLDYTAEKADICAFAASEKRQPPVIITQGAVSSPFTTAPQSEVETNG